MSRWHIKKNPLLSGESTLATSGIVRHRQKLVAGKQLANETYQGNTQESINIPSTSAGAQLDQSVVSDAGCHC